ncbi:type I methionyl aminopeptidase [Candidatus Woesebacteria bacterium RIFCSPHIGHO2_01_FULL_39_17]|uniref:Methionine aminopeptidase n=5 Tax=Microgenomates group TaxID=1794810 RepID=A0A0H4TAL0_9BACT|nr:methionine aminopeptidase, methionyl aminopeptidase [uncultured Microgenomates bacterium Rifle_16ft_4_minimus_954]AKQ05529.1 methionine aminopeptidase, methionyl aminopeptidase [uncultured Microgenomates bacterium Rifle_16ft_4_minimus_24053]KKQ51939.1 MAG: methionine aminopeptidase, type I, methionyl aminopeptidase [Microgenomates group bacterium GW2011_GWC1_38_12]KKQ94397.1 MAG: Methionine aminopeptidase [Candidatus Woesebacteria bacterium GW2011_GWB1_39_10b]KKR14409.1 MAG: Methionine amino
MRENTKIPIKTPDEIEVMREGGRKLVKVKKELLEAVKEGVRASEIDNLADKLIEKEGGEASFKMVSGYSWATCVNINEGVVHGIPKKEIVFKRNDVVSVDVGMFYKGFHTDTSFTKAIGSNPNLERFLGSGRSALEKAIQEARIGNRIYDISQAIESTMRKNGYSPIRALVGHGVGRALHEEPQVPCFTNGNREESPEIPLGAVFAVEVMYAMGSPDVKIASDGWTISTSDGTISGLFEDTVVVSPKGPLVIT